MNGNEDEAIQEASQKRTEPGNAVRGDHDAYEAAQSGSASGSLEEQMDTYATMPSDDANEESFDVEKQEIINPRGKLGIVPLALGFLSIATLFLVGVLFWSKYGQHSGGRTSIGSLNRSHTRTNYTQTLSRSHNRTSSDVQSRTRTDMLSQMTSLPSVKRSGQMMKQIRRLWHPIAALALFPVLAWTAHYAYTHWLAPEPEPTTAQKLLSFSTSLSGAITIVLLLSALLVFLTVKPPTQASQLQPLFTGVALSPLGDTDYGRLAYKWEQIRVRWLWLVNIRHRLLRESPTIANEPWNGPNVSSVVPFFAPDKAGTVALKLLQTDKAVDLAWFVLLFVDSSLFLIKDRRQPGQYVALTNVDQLSFPFALNQLGEPNIEDAYKLTDEMLKAARQMTGNRSLFLEYDWELAKAYAKTIVKLEQKQLYPQLVGDWIIGNSNLSGLSLKQLFKNGRLITDLSRPWDSTYRSQTECYSSVEKIDDNTVKFIENLQEYAITAEVRMVLLKWELEVDGRQLRSDLLVNSGRKVNLTDLDGNPLDEQCLEGETIKALWSRWLHEGKFGSCPFWIFTNRTWGFDLGALASDSQIGVIVFDEAKWSHLYKLPTWIRKLVYNYMDQVVNVLYEPRPNV